MRRGGLIKPGGGRPQELIKSGGRRRGGGLTESDRVEWARFASQVSPLPGVAVPVVPETPAAAVPGKGADAGVAVVIAAPLAKSVARGAPPLVVGDSPGGVDRSTWARFRGGKLPAVRTLDLHGRTVQRAHGALEQFLHQAVADGVRCVEVITGRGSGEAGGVIRREFPLWLNQAPLRGLILGAAHPHALNPGSVRLLLRRSRGRADGDRRMWRE